MTNPIETITNLKKGCKASDRINICGIYDDYICSECKAELKATIQAYKEWLNDLEELNKIDYRNYNLKIEKINNKISQLQQAINEGESNGG